MSDLESNISAIREHRRVLMFHFEKYCAGCDGERRSKRLVSKVMGVSLGVKETVKGFGMHPGVISSCT